MKFILYVAMMLLMLTSYTEKVFATSVFFIKKNIKMSNSEPVRHDFYLNAGANNGLKAGMVITVTRKVPFQDAVVLNISEELSVPVAELELIHVQGGLSVARLSKSLVSEGTPILDYSNVMIGDTINLGSKKWPKKRSRKNAAKPKPKSKAVGSSEGQRAMSSTEKNEVKIKNIAGELKNEKQGSTIKSDVSKQEVDLKGEFKPQSL
ncbi:MAG: hypothetical protein AB8E15_08110 [Bdellovibrionales bacterium]